MESIYGDIFRARLRAAAERTPLNDRIADQHGTARDAPTGRHLAEVGRARVLTSAA